MPELPEVETIKNQLVKLLSDKKIQRVEILLPKIIKKPAADFQKIVTGAKIEGFERRAKILIWELDNGWSLLFHLKLSGQLIYNGERNKFTHVIFYFTDGNHLIFNDMRQFGYIKLIKTSERNSFFEKEKFGPEPLQKDFTIKKFIDILSRRPNAKIKQFLLDQTNIVGIGNIYSDEILFFSKIHPFRLIKTLGSNEIKRIFLGIKKILPQAIKLGGTSSNLYVNALGKEGKFLPKLKAYGREGEKCVKCKGRVQRIKIGGRSAHFCPGCQKLRRTFLR